jgi:hypothetical protein
LLAFADASPPSMTTTTRLGGGRTGSGCRGGTVDDNATGGELFLFFGEEVGATLLSLEVGVLLLSLEVLFALLSLED